MVLQLHALPIVGIPEQTFFLKEYICVAYTIVKTTILQKNCLHCVFPFLILLFTNYKIYLKFQYFPQLCWPDILHI